MAYIILTLWPYFWISAQAVQECIENQLTNSLCEVYSLSLFYGLKLQLILLQTVLLSLPFNNLP